VSTGKQFLESNPFRAIPPIKH
jgi:hypothetical protein